MSRKSSPSSRTFPRAPSICHMKVQPPRQKSELSRNLGVYVCSVQQKTAAESLTNMQNCRRRASMLETTVEPPRAVRPTPAPPHSSKPAMQRKSPADPRHACRAMHVSLIPSVGLVSSRCPPRFVRFMFCILQISTLAAPAQPPNRLMHRRTDRDTD